MKIWVSYEKLRGAKTINHWDARKKSSAPKKKVPQDTDCIVMLTSFLNHNTMLKYKNEAKMLGRKEFSHRVHSHLAS